jgi:hypothetical protein
LFGVLGVLQPGLQAIDKWVRQRFNALTCFLKLYFKIGVAALSSEEESSNHLILLLLGQIVVFRLFPRKQAKND